MKLSKSFTLTTKPNNLKNLKGKDMKRAAKLLRKLKSEVYEGTEASQWILSIEENMVTLQEVEAIAEHDLDTDELKTLVDNLDYLNRYCNQIWQSKQLRRK